MLLLLAVLVSVSIASGRRMREGSRTESGEGSADDNANFDYYRFLYKRMREAAVQEKKRDSQPPEPYSIPGPFEPLPGRSHNGNYWPLFPFSSQYSGGVDLDPSIARHIGGDINVPIPSWGMMDISGRYYNRIQYTTTKFGYHASPVNLLGLERDQFITLMSDPSLHFNRANHPIVPIAKVPKSMVPMSCRPPLCNPYTQNFALGIEQDVGGHNGVEGDIDIPVPISKEVAYRFPFSGNIYYHPDNLTITYGHNIANVDPFYSMFEYQKHTPPLVDLRRRRRSISTSPIGETAIADDYGPPAKMFVYDEKLMRTDGLRDVLEIAPTDLVFIPDEMTVIGYLFD